MLARNSVADMQVNLPNSGGLAAVKHVPSGDDFGRNLVCIVRDNNPSLGSFLDGARPYCATVAPSHVYSALRTVSQHGMCCCTFIEQTRC